MSTRGLYRLAAAAVMVSPFLFVLGVALGGPPPAVTPLPHVLIVTFAVLLLMGLPGLYLRQREESGALGLVGVALVFVSIFLLAGFNYLSAFLVPGLAQTAPEVLQRFPEGEWRPLVALNMAGRIGLAVGLVMFGLASYRARVLPRWAAVVAGLGGIGAIVQLVVELLELPEPLGMMVLLLPVGLLGLGWGLWSSVA